MKTSKYFRISSKWFSMSSKLFHVLPSKLQIEIDIDYLNMLLLNFAVYYRGRQQTDLYSGKNNCSSLHKKWTA